MSQYLPMFNRDAKGKYNPNLGFVTIKNGTDAYVLEDEMNEMQWIQSEGRANLVRQIAKSGCLQIPSPNNPVLPGGIVELGSGLLNSFNLNGFDAVLNGYISHIDTDKQNGFKIQLTDPPVTGTRYDLLFLEFWFDELKQYDPIPMFGGYENAAVNYELIDKRLNVETTQRIQLQWRLRTLEDVKYPDIVNYNLGQIAIYAQGPNPAANINYRYYVSGIDKFMLITGNGSDSDKDNLNTQDGYTYAIPIFAVKRLNKSGYNPSYNVNGGVNYINEDTVSGRPDSKFSNIIYADQIVDLRHLSALGVDQLKDIYVTISDFQDYENTVKLNIQNPLENLVTSVATFHQDYNNEVVQINNKIDTTATNISKQEQDDILDINTQITSLNSTINNTIVTDITALDNKIASVNTSLTLYINTKIEDTESDIADLSTQFNNIINQDIVVLNGEISDLQNTLNVTIATQVSTINDKLNIINSNISGINATLVTHQQEIDDLSTNITTLITATKTNLESEILGAKNDVISMHNTDVTAINLKIDNLNASLTTIINNNINSLNSRVDTISIQQTSKDDYLQSEIDQINLEIITINNELGSYGVSLSSLNARLTQAESDIRDIQIQLNSLFPDGNATDLMKYGLDMNRKAPTTVGGTLNADKTVTCIGTLMSVTYAAKTEYSLACTAQSPADNSVPVGSIGDIWVERADTSFSFKNTGLPGVPIELFAISNDNIRAWSNADTTNFTAATFSGTTGTRINKGMKPATDFVYIMPIQNYMGEIGEIYITMDAAGFTVYNTGRSGNAFEWTAIDTTAYNAGGYLRNYELYDLALSGQVGIAQAGQFGGKYYSVMVSTPIITGDTDPEFITPGQIGDISVTKSTGYFTLFNTGSAICKVRTLVFNQVITQAN